MVREAEQKNKKTLKASSSHLCCVVSLHTTCAGRASQDECVKLFYAHRRCHSCRADYRWWIALHGERWELRWGAAQSDITFCFTWTGAAMQGKNPWLRAITEMQSVIINEHRKVESLENFLSSSALKTLSALKPGEPCWQRGLERKKKKSPSEIPLTQTTTRCLMRLWQPWPISRTPLWQEWSKMLEQMLLLFRLPPCGFSRAVLNLDFLREEMLAHPAQPLPAVQLVSERRTLPWSYAAHGITRVLHRHFARQILGVKM